MTAAVATLSRSDAAAVISHGPWRPAFAQGSAFRLHDADDDVLYGQWVANDTLLLLQVLQLKARSAPGISPPAPKTPSTLAPQWMEMPGDLAGEGQLPARSCLPACYSAPLLRPPRPVCLQGGLLGHISARSWAVQVELLQVELGQGLGGTGRGLGDLGICLGVLGREHGHAEPICTSSEGGGHGGQRWSAECDWLL